MCAGLPTRNADPDRRTAVQGLNHSLIDQPSTCLGETRTATASASAGTAGDEPGVFHSVRPRGTTAPARVRGTRAPPARPRTSVPGGAVQQTNCHPFRHGQASLDAQRLIKDPIASSATSSSRLRPSSIRRSKVRRLETLLRVNLSVSSTTSAAVAGDRPGGGRSATARHASIPSGTIPRDRGIRLWAFRYSSEWRDTVVVLQHQRRVPVRFTPTIRGCRGRRRVAARRLRPLGDLPGVWNEVPARWRDPAGADELPPFAPIALAGTARTRAPARPDFGRE
jgi:glutamine amidotransferase